MVAGERPRWVSIARVGQHESARFSCALAWGKGEAELEMLASGLLASRALRLRPAWGVDMVST